MVTTQPAARARASAARPALQVGAKGLRVAAAAAQQRHLGAEPEPVGGVQPEQRQPS